MSSSGQAPNVSMDELLASIKGMIEGESNGASVAAAPDDAGDEGIMDLTQLMQTAEPVMQTAMPDQPPAQEFLAAPAAGALMAPDPGAAPQLAAPLNAAPQLAAPLDAMQMDAAQAAAVQSGMGQIPAVDDAGVMDLGAPIGAAQDFSGAQEQISAPQTDVLGGDGTAQEAATQITDLLGEMASDFGTDPSVMNGDANPADFGFEAANEAPVSQNDPMAQGDPMALAAPFAGDPMSEMGAELGAALEDGIGQGAVSQELAPLAPQEMAPQGQVPQLQDPMVQSTMAQSTMLESTMGQNPQGMGGLDQRAESELAMGEVLSQADASLSGALGRGIADQNTPLPQHVAPPFGHGLEGAGQQGAGLEAAGQNPLPPMGQQPIDGQHVPQQAMNPQQMGQLGLSSQPLEQVLGGQSIAEAMGQPMGGAPFEGQQQAAVMGGMPPAGQQGQLPAVANGGGLPVPAGFNSAAPMMMGLPDPTADMLPAEMRNNLEEIVKQLLKPLLREWLAVNLPELLKGAVDENGRIDPDRL